MRLDEACEFTDLAQAASKLPHDGNFWRELLATSEFARAAKCAAVKVCEDLGKSNDRSLVGDVSQSIALRILVSPFDPKKFDPEKNLAGFFRNMLVWYGWSSLRGKSQLRGHERIERVELNEWAGNNASSQLDRLERQIELREAMQSLELRQQLALRKYYFEDQPLAEVAKCLNCSVGHASRVLAAARAALGDRLRKMGYDK